MRGSTARSTLFCLWPGVMVRWDSAPEGSFGSKTDFNSRIDESCRSRCVSSEEAYKLTHVIAEPCIGVKDKSCVDVCPVDCIHEGDEMLFIDPAECIDCGLCVPECPVDAIFFEDDLPENWKKFTEMNADFFNK